MLCQTDCKCCQKALRTGSFWHCEFCWNKWHNGLRDRDWISREEWEKSGRGERDREIWRKIQEEIKCGGEIR